MAGGHESEEALNVAPQSFGVGDHWSPGFAPTSTSKRTPILKSRSVGSRREFSTPPLMKCHFLRQISPACTGKNGIFPLCRCPPQGEISP